MGSRDDRKKKKSGLNKFSKNVWANSKPIAVAKIQAGKIASSKQIGLHDLGPRSTSVVVCTRCQVTHCAGVGEELDKMSAGW